MTFQCLIFSNPAKIAKDNSFFSWSCLLKMLKCIYKYNNTDLS